MILTAAHCVKRTFDYKSNGVLYQAEIIPNFQFPSLTSMYTVYLGLQDKSDINRNISFPTVKMSVSQIVVVNKNLFL